MEIQTDQWAETILDNIPNGIILTDMNGNVLFLNRIAEKTFGYIKGEIVGRSISILFDNKNEFPFSKLLRKKQNEKWTMVTKDGSKISKNLFTRLFEEHQNQESYVVISYTDADQLQLEEENLKHIHAIAEIIFNSSSNAIITAAKDGTIRSVNNAACQMFGYSDDKLIGKNLKILMPFPFSLNQKKILRRYLIRNEAESFDKRREVTGLRKDNTVFPIELMVGEVTIDGVPHFAGIIRDLSDRRTLERRLVEISNEERSRIGRDLHDGLGQTLTGIRMLSENLARKMEANGLPYSDEIQEIATMINDADEMARSISRDMIHVDIEKRGLKVAIQELCKKTTKMTGINCEFDVKGNVEIADHSTGLHLYRIVQEAVNNAVKHGKPKNIRVKILQGNHYISLTIDDDGCGFDASKINEEGTGLQTMNHRAGIIGGGIEFFDTDEGFTRVRCIIPIVNDIIN